MYRCSSCGSDIDDGFDRCWNCNEAVPGTVLGEPHFALPTKLVASYRIFRESGARGDETLTEASAFATGLGRERVISISNVSEPSGIAVTVWFWSDRPQSSERALHTDNLRARERDLIILDPG